MQIIGFDGSRVYARQRITLSSIKQSTAHMAKYAVEKLLLQIESKSKRTFLGEATVIPVSFEKGITTK